MTEVSIRQATVADVDRILELYRNAEIESESPFTVAEARTHFEVFERYPNYRVFVAVLNGEIVGTYELLIMDNLAKHGRRSGVVEDVAVSPEHQGLGIGRAMMNHAMAMCREADCYKLVLSSGLKRTRAHDFYDSVGFERHGFSFRIHLDEPGTSDFI
jgi:ribosomal protein S18 acetylase RimI-like enzyme